MKPIDDHRDLAAWRKAISVGGKVYMATRQLPLEERGDLGPLLRGSAVSIARHIAEGAVRGNRAEFLQFLHLALRSLSQLEAQMTIVVDQGLLPTDASALNDLTELGQLLTELIQSLTLSGRQAHARACSPPLLPRKMPRTPAPLASG
ncbi:four helix bundle protein [Povalibacter sp.]|uniref:four helix bundle protein n=1 Tax=Povalibacter sp. TaxID=1962978 RepID=UPI002F42380B